MTEQQIANPFDSDHFKTGGGVWNEKTVTLVKAYFGLQTDNTGKPFVRDGVTQDDHALHIIGIVEGQEKERREMYSIGALRGTAEGEGYTKADGSAGVLHKSSNGGKFFAALKTSGFDMSRLFVDGKQKVSGLNGARIIMTGVERLNKKGETKVSKNGFTEYWFYPQTTVGYVGTAAAKANGAAGLDAKLRTIVAGIIKEKGGSVSRVDLVKSLSVALKGEADGAQGIVLASQETFLKGGPWSYNGTQLSA